MTKPTYLAVVGHGLEILGVELAAALHLPQLQLQRDVALFVDDLGGCVIVVVSRESMEGFECV